MLNINKKIIDYTLLISVQGIVDYSTLSTFNRDIGELTTITRILIDFSEMEFIDSTGIGAILDILYLGSENNCSVEFTGLGRDATDLFETVGVFQILETLQGR